MSMFLPMAFDWSGALSVLGWLQYVFLTFAVISTIALGAELAMRARKGNEAMWMFTDELMSVFLGVWLVSAAGSITSLVL